MARFDSILALIIRFDSIVPSIVRIAAEDIGAPSRILRQHLIPGVFFADEDCCAANDPELSKLQEVITTVCT